MTLIKRTSAWEEISRMASDDWESFSPIMHAIIDNHVENALDNVVAHEFPNGVEEDELRRFFLTERDFILNELGCGCENPSTK